MKAEQHALPPADRAAVAAAMLVAGLLIGQQVAGRALRDALFLSAFSATSLPGMMLVSAVVSASGAFAFAGAMARRPPVAVLAGTLLFSSVLFVLQWRYALEHPRLVATALYIQLALLGPGMVSSFWSLVNERFDPHTARRVVGRIGTGAALGGVVGGVSAWAGTRVVAAPTLLLGLSVTSLLILVGLTRLRAASGLEESDAPSGGILVAVRWIHEFPYLRQLAALVALGALADALLDYLLKAGAAGAFPSRQQLAGFFSLFYACVALLTLAVQASVTRRALTRVGLAGTVAFQPAAIAMASLAGLVFPTLASAVMARGVGGALRDSLFRSGYELFYAPLPAWRKRRTKALVDVAADKLGSALGAGIVMAMVALSLVSARGLWLLALLAMLASLALTRRLHEGYVRALEQSLRSGFVALEPDELVDATTRQTFTRVGLDRESVLAGIRALHGAEVADPQSPDLGEELRSGQADRVRGALAKVRSSDRRLAQMLITLLGRDDVFPDVLRALRRLAPQILDPLIDALVDPGQPAVVRRRIPRVLKACPNARTVDGLLRGLEAADLSVRRACGVVLAWLQERRAGISLPMDRLYQAVAQEVKTPEADVDAQLDHVFTLLSAVGEREPLRVSRWALRGHDPRLRGTALEYLDQVLPEAVRQPLLRRLGAMPAASAVQRPRDEVEEELRRSAASLPRGLLARPPRSRS